VIVEVWYTNGGPSRRLDTDEEQIEMQQQSSLRSMISDVGYILYLQPKKVVDFYLNGYDLSIPRYAHDDEGEREEEENLLQRNVRLNFDGSKQGGWCSPCAKLNLCGSFPNDNTGNQFFDRQLWTNYHLLGRQMAAEALEQLFSMPKRRSAILNAGADLNSK